MFQLELLLALNKLSNEFSIISKDICKQDLEANIWAQKGSEWGVKKIQNEELHGCTVHLMQSGCLNLEDYGQGI